MMDRSDSIRSVQNAETESSTLMRQLHLWLALGSAGGAVSMFSIAAGSANANHAIHFFQWSLWAFLIGVTSAGLSVFFLSMRASALGEHIAASANRENFKDAARQIPEIISSPRKLADEANAPRNKLIAQSDEQDKQAEASHLMFRVYSTAWKTSLSASALGFVSGFAIPLIQLTFLGGTFAPLQAV